MAKQLPNNLQLVKNKKFSSFDIYLYSPDDRSYQTINSGYLKELELLAGKDYAKILKTKAILCEFEFDPTKESGIVDNKDSYFKTFNVYMKPKWRDNVNLEGSKELPECYKNFFNHLFAADTDSIEYVLDWMANSLRNRNLTVLTMVGVQGAGKGIFSDILIKLHGRNNSAIIRDDSFKGRFNSQLQYKTYISIDEVKLRDTESLNRFKQIVNSQIEIERKGENAETIDNYANYTISSNNIDFLKLDYQDRRISLVKMTEVPLYEIYNSQKIEFMFKELVAEENIKKLGEFLLVRQIERSMAVPFRSEQAFKDVVDLSLSEAETKILYEIIPNHLGEKMTLKEVQDKLNGMLMASNRIPGVIALKNLSLKVPGYFKMSFMRKPNGKREWCLLVSSVLPELKEQFSENTIDATEAFRVKFDEEKVGKKS